MMKEYSSKRRIYKIYSSIALAIFLTLAFMTSYPSWEMVFYKMLLSVYVVSTMAILTELVIRHLFHYIFSVPNPYWKKEIDRPRVACLAFSIILALISYNAVSNRGTETIQFWSNLIGGLVLLLFAMVIIFVIWTEKFEKLFVGNIRARLYHFHPAKCIINNQDYNIINILSDLKDELSTSAMIFNAVIELKDIQPKERIVVHLSKADLIRFSYIFFKIKDLQPKFKREFINKYFVDKDGKEFILENEATFSRIDSDVVNKKESHINLENRLLSVIEKHKYVKG